MSNASELEEIRELINERLATIEQERQALEKTVAAFERSTADDSERAVRLEIFNRGLDLLENKSLDLNHLLLALPKGPTISHKDNADSWAGYLQYLQSAENRRKDGEEIELLRMAADKAKERLGAYHTYLNGEVERPILNAESVMRDE